MSGAFLVSDLIAPSSLSGSLSFVLAKANLLSDSTDAVERRIVFNRLNVENVRTDVAEATVKVSSNCKSILIFGKTAIQSAKRPYPVAVPDFSVDVSERGSLLSERNRRRLDGLERR